MGCVKENDDESDEDTRNGTGAGEDRGEGVERQISYEGDDVWSSGVFNWTNGFGGTVVVITIMEELPCDKICNAHASRMRGCYKGMHFSANEYEMAV